MSQVPVKWVPNMFLADKPVEGWDALQVPVVPLSALRDLFKDYYIGLAALAQTSEDTLLRATVETRLQQATQRLLVSLGEVGKQGTNYPCYERKAP